MAEPAATNTEQSRNAFGRLVDLAVTAIPPLVSAIGIVTFVALIGGAIQWVRFYAAGLPADQAVRAMPKAELVVIGAVSLVGFLIAGALVALLVFLVERQSINEDVPLQALLVLTVAELALTLVLVEEEWWAIVLLAAWFVAMGVVAERTFRGLPDVLTRLGSRKELWEIRDSFERAADDYDDASAHVRLMPPNGAAAPEAVETRTAMLRQTSVELEAARREWARALDDWHRTDAWEVADLPKSRPPAKAELAAALTALAAREKDERGRFSERRRWGAVVVATLVAGAIPVALTDDLRWVLAILAIAALLTTVNYMIARVTPRFAWYGLAVFASVTLFGAALSTVRTIRSPKIQPMALLRKSDDRPICGAYVTESDKRVYVARVVPDPKGDGTKSTLGRVFWIDLDDVDTVSVGPLQKVQSAGHRLEALAREIVKDRPEPAPAKPKPVVETKVERRGRGRRTVTVTTTREVPPTGIAAGPKASSWIASCTSTGSSETP